MSSRNVTALGVRNALMEALSVAYPGVTAYAELMEEGHAVPCFYVKDSPILLKKVMGNRYISSHTFEILYYPATTKPDEESREVADFLCEIMEFIPYGGSFLRAAETQYAFNEGILQFTFTIDIRVLRQNDHPPLMTAMDMEGTIQ